MRWLTHDVRLAFRALRKGGASTAAAIVCLALGIGGATAMFSVLDAVLLRPPAFHDLDRIVVLQDVVAHGYDPRLAPADYLELKEWSRSFGELAGYAALDVNLTGAGAPERIRAESVSPGFFEVFGVPPQRGRGFLPDRDTADVHEVVLSYRCWRNRFAADPGLLGRTLLLDGVPHAVVGIASDSFEFPEGTEMWLRSYRYGVPEPPAPVGDDLDQVRGAGYFGVVGRLAGGVTLDQAGGDVLGLALRWGLEWIVIGQAAGLAIGLGLTGAIRSQLFEISATDPAVLAGVCAFVGAAGTLAACLPALRASRLDPVRILKYE